MWLAFLFVFVVGGGALFGAPYLPTRRRQIEALIKLTKPTAKDLFVDLGCGDGRLLKAMAKCGARAVGYEVNPFWVLVAKLRTWPERRLVKVVWANMWGQRIPTDATIIYVFLIRGWMERLEKKLTREAKGKVAVSYGFKLPGLSARKTLDGLHVYDIKG